MLSFLSTAYCHINYRIANLPRWRNLNHFDHVTSVTFSDARKYEDILKVCLPFDMQIILKFNQMQMTIFATHNIITHSDHPGGYLLLKVLRSYIHLRQGPICNPSKGTSIIVDTCRIIKSKCIPKH